MKVIFGPINSRRFKKSLGIDLSPDKKTCNFDCLYCELGKAKTTHINSSNLSVSMIIDELSQALKIHNDCDFISISANGEPTLYPNLKELIIKINEIKGNAKSLILSNASTIFEPKIQDALMLLDAVKLSLDSVNPKVFRKIDRTNISVENIINGIKSFSDKYQGELILECLILENINDNPKDILALNEILKDIKITRLDLGTIDRPSDYQVKALDYQSLKNLSKLITNANVNIITKPNTNNSYDDLLKTINLRPLRIDEIKASDKAYLDEMILQEKIKLININGVDFYKLNKN